MIQFGSFRAAKFDHHVLQPYSTVLPRNACAALRQHDGIKDALCAASQFQAVPWHRTPKRQKITCNIAADHNTHPDAEPTTAVQLSQFRDVDQDLWRVLELTSDDELESVHNTLHGRSLFSPLLKTLVADNEPASVAICGRATMMYRVEQRFRFLAADSITVLRGRRPSYRDALLRLRERLEVECASTLSTPDLETEIFLAVMQRHMDLVQGLDSDTAATAASYVTSGDGMAGLHSSGSSSSPHDAVKAIQAPLKLGAQEVLNATAKFVGAVGASKVSLKALQKLAGQLLAQHSRYEAAVNLLCQVSSRGAACAVKQQAAVKAAQGAFTQSVARYAALRSAAAVVNPVLWAWLSTDLVLMSLGTDYSRLLQAVVELAQVRLLRTHGFVSAVETSMDEIEPWG